MVKFTKIKNEKIKLIYKKNIVSKTKFNHRHWCCFEAAQIIKEFVCIRVAISSWPSIFSIKILNLDT